MEPTMHQSLNFLAKRHGLGVLGGTLSSGDEAVYYGGVYRIHRVASEDDSETDRSMWQMLEALTATRLPPCAVPVGPLELIGCFDTDSCDVLLLCRILCVERPG